MNRTTASQRPPGAVRRFRAVALVAACVGLVVPGALVTAPAGSAEPVDTLVETGQIMATDREVTTGERNPPPLIVDEVNNLGFALGAKTGDATDKRLAMFDLKGLAQIATIREPAIQQLGSRDIYTFAVDPATRRVLFPSPLQLNPAWNVCLDGSPDPTLVPDSMGLQALRYQFDPGTGTGSFANRSKRLPMPCAGTKSISVNSLSIYTATDRAGQPVRKLLATGTYVEEGWRYNLPDPAVQNNAGQALIVRQFDLDKLLATEGVFPGADRSALDWEVDLRLSGCGRFDALLVERVADDVVTLCSDPRPVIRSGVGEQGYVVRIPLSADHKPTLPDGEARRGDPTNPTNDAFHANAVVRRTPSLAGTVFPFVDQASRRLLLLTADDANGNAVWVFDIKEERFVGIMTGGVVGQAPTKTAAGFNPATGTTYLLTGKGLLAASVRPSPLPGGRVYPVVSGTERVSYPRIGLAVAPGLRRIFVPVVGKGYVVVEDRLVPPASVPPLDPDTFTHQIDEVPGKTETNASGSAIASGAHVLAVGGIPRIVNQLDPLCHSPHDFWTTTVNRNLPPGGQNVEPALLGGSCLADALVTRGDREALLATTDIDAAYRSEAVAESSGVRFEDEATDADIRELGNCGYGYLQRLQRPFSWLSERDADPNNDFSPQSPAGQDGGFCDGVQDGLSRALGGDDLRNGTRGGEHETAEEQERRLREGGPAPAAGHGFPIPASACQDFGANPSGATGPGGAKSLVTASAVACDAAASKAGASAAAAGFALPSLAEPLVSVGRTWSTVETVRSGEGQVTLARAGVESLQVGPLLVGEIRSTARTTAKGRSGSATATFERLWCRISILPPDVAGLELPDPTAALPAPGLVTDECVNPDTSAELKALIDDLNQALGRVRIDIPATNVSLGPNGKVRAGEATPGGYQAVLTKHGDVRAADRDLNHDDSHTVPAVQVTVYNDGPEGLNRVIVQLAGVHAESRYGVVPVPNFDIPDIPEFDFVDDPVVAALELASGGGPVFEDIPGLPAIPASFESPGGGNPLAEFFHAPFSSLRDLFGWIMQNWREAMLLFLLLSILSTPLYLFLRRRAFEQVIAP